MRVSGYIVEHYTMIHSKWFEENPVYGQRCSSIRINGSEGFWFSTNCSEKFPYICVNEDDKLVLPGLTLTSTSVMESSIESRAITSDVIENAALHGKAIKLQFIIILNTVVFCTYNFDVCKASS